MRIRDKEEIDTYPGSAAAGPVSMEYYLRTGDKSPIIEK
jgi:hypothetical protein